MTEYHPLTAHLHTSRVIPVIIALVVLRTDPAGAEEG